MIATVLVCGRMFNGAPEELTGRTEILIEGSRTEGIGRSDLSDHTVDAGSFDTRVHLTMDASNVA